MGLPRVDIQIQNGGLGLIAAQDDRVMGLIFNATETAVAALFSLADANAWADSLATAGVIPEVVADIRGQLADFYKEAGDGAELWVRGVQPSLTLAQIFTQPWAAGLVDGSGGRINVLGVSRFLADEPSPLVLTEGIEGDMVAALDEAQAFVVAMQAAYKPLRIILDGKNFSGNASTVHNLKTHSYNGVGVCLATNKADSVTACLGLLLGRIAAIPVNHNIGRVRAGSAFTDVAFLTDKAPVTLFDSGKYNTLNDKGYIFLRKHVGLAGFYWNDDHMCTADTDDYFSLSTGRVIDKASRIIRRTFLDEVLESVPVDEKGRVVQTVLKQYQEKAERAIGLTMGAAGEISFVDCFIDPAQDILATSELIIDVRITPTGTNRVITIKLGLFNPNVTA